MQVLVSAPVWVAMETLVLAALVPAPSLAEGLAFATQLPIRQLAPLAAAVPIRRLAVPLPLWELALARAHAMPPMVAALLIRQLAVPLPLWGLAPTRAHVAVPLAALARRRELLLWEVGAPMAAVVAALALALTPMLTLARARLALLVLTSTAVVVLTAAAAFACLEEH